MGDQFFTAFDRGTAPLVLTVRDIIPDTTTSAEARSRAIYVHYARSIRRRSMDPELRLIRQKALAGTLDTEDYSRMNQLLEVIQAHAQRGGHMMPPGKESGRFQGYARTNSYAMLIAQILFTNNAVIEGLPERIDRDCLQRLVDEVSAFVRTCSSENGEAVSDDEARFYATLFSLQTAFDRLFVPDHDIGTYHPESGAYHLDDRYQRHVGYLHLSNGRIATASRAERQLCWNITSGWSEGIDRETWDLLNLYYYNAISPTTGKQNLFAKHYDELLERMLPQFTYSKVRLANEVLSAAPSGATYRILEIGAGSDALAIDLAMACRRRDVDLSKIEYRGVEPSEFMRRNFRSNMERKLHNASFPDSWQLTDGTLESVTANPEAYVLPGRTSVIFSYSAHHCFHRSMDEFLANPTIRSQVRDIWILDVTSEHGWTKPYYMWADCESPEDFSNVTRRGDWNSTTLWTEPCSPLEGSAITNAWCALRRLTP